jgi:hypothetical protein
LGTFEFFFIKICRYALRALPLFFGDDYGDAVKLMLFPEVTNCLPIGAKLDYREDADRLSAKVNAENEKYFRESEEIMRKNELLIADMRRLMEKQRKLFEEVGVEPSAPNPFLKLFEGSVDGVDELAKFARESEMAYVDSLNLTPKDGWEAAMQRATNGNIGRKKTGSIGELSSILMKKSDKIGSTEYSYAADGDSSSDEKFDTHSEKAGPVCRKKVVKRLRI